MKNTIHRHPSRYWRQAILALAAITAVVTAAAPARAQSMDYGALEQLFGEPVTTSAIGAPQRARDVPAEMEIITADDIRRSGAIDIPGVLSHVVGIDVQRWSNFAADVAVRGYESPMTPRLLVLINGRQVYNNDFGRTEWAALPVELAEIRQIEIVKGPNSALFGFNATGGVINIITFNPLYDTVNTATITGGTQNYLDVSAIATARINEDLAVRLSAGGTQGEDFKSQRGFATNTGLQQRAARGEVSADAHWRIDSTSEFELELTDEADKHLVQIPIWIPAFINGTNSSVLGRYMADTSVGSITATAYSNWSHVSGILPAPTSRLEWNNQLTVANVQDIFKPSANHTVRIAAEYRNSSINTSPVAGSVISYNMAALSAMWNWAITPAISLTAATRLDTLWLHRAGDTLPGSGLTNQQWSRQISQPSYNLGAVWQPDHLNTFRLTAARGVQLPSLINFGATQGFLVPGFALDGNPDLNPTVVKNYEIDWDHSLPAIQAQTRFALFYETTRDITSFFSPTTTSIAPAGYFLGLVGNVANSEELGAEFSVKGVFARDWRWRLSYAPRLVHDSFTPGDNPANTGVNFEHATPRHVVDTSLGWSSGAWEVDGFLRLQSSADGQFITNRQTFMLVPLGPTVSFDARAGYRINTNVTLSLAGQNVLFSSARQTAFGKIDQRVLAGLSAHF